MTMAIQAAPVLLITGAMAAGKSTVAQYIAEQLEPSVHLRGDVFRRMVVNGREDMSAAPSAAALRQLLLRYRAAAASAKIYGQAGFNVVYQDVILGPPLIDVIAMFAGWPLHVIVLCPDRATIAAREQARDKIGYTQVSIEQLQQALEDTPKLGLWVDSSKQTVAQTAQAILENLDQARVDV